MLEYLTLWPAGPCLLLLTLLLLPLAFLALTLLALLLLLLLTFLPLKSVPPLLPQHLALHLLKVLLPHPLPPLGPGLALSPGRGILLVPSSSFLRSGSNSSSQGLPVRP